MSVRTGRARLSSLVFDVAAAVAVSTVAVAAKLLVAALFAVNGGFVVYVPAIAFAAWYRGLLAGLLATVITAAADLLLAMPPLHVLALTVPEDEFRFVAYLLGGASVSFVIHHLRASRDVARREAGERRRALDAEAEARRELDRLVDLERRSSQMREAFNSIVSHELRTPITSIYAGAKLLARRDRQLDEATRQELLDDLEAEADRLYRLVEDLLVLARSERGTVESGDEPILIAHVAERVIRSEQARWPAARFDLRPAATMPAARGEETYVEQVLRNLLSNAAKYSRAGTSVEVEIDETEDGVRVRVLDEGSGIDPAEAGRLFELYYRSPATSGTVGGAGIGLYVCRALVEAMGGRVWAKPRPEGGSEFGFILPRYDDDEPEELRTAAREQPAVSGRAAETGRRGAVWPTAGQSPAPRTD